MSVQNLAVASQKLTWPGVTGVLPAITVAVRVTTLPGATVVTAFPPEVTDSVVIVGAGAAHAGSCSTPWPKRPPQGHTTKGARGPAALPLQTTFAENAWMISLAQRDRWRGLGAG